MKAYYASGQAKEKTGQLKTWGPFTGTDIVLFLKRHDAEAILSLSDKGARYVDSDGLTWWTDNIMG